jgi:riboflavin kinase/FMN adenylyltransferase
VNYACTIGFFDGVHRGHQYLLQHLMTLAAGRGMQTLVITFARSPLTTLCPEKAPKLLSDEEEKRDFIVKLGIDRCEMMDFSRQMAALTAREFLRLRLVPMGVRLLLMGYDHRFGSDRLSFSEVKDMAAGMGVEVVSAKALEDGGSAVSSSEIRALLSAGQVRDVQALLGRPYELSGIVVPGRREGTALGFPTANMEPRCAEKVIPACGAYAVRAAIDGKTYEGMMNIGTRPTLKNGADISLETHLFGFTGEAYGKMLAVSFMERIRDEREFPSPEDLRRQLLADAQTAQKILRQ